MILEDIKKVAKTDEFIICMKKQVRWNIKKKGRKVSPFSICDKMLIYADRVVMPCVLQKILKEFPMGHLGICRMKSLMRSYTYWPKMDQDIEKMIRECKGCQSAPKAPPIKTQLWPKTDIPWIHIHVNYAGPLMGYYYLVMVDSFSKWSDIYRCKNPTARNTIKALDKVFSCFGVPNTVISDKRTMFTGKEFSDYCYSLAIKHITTPAYNPRSNGQAERFVDLFKSALKKKNHRFETEEKGIQRFLVVYRIMPNLNTNSNLSPAEISSRKRKMVKQLRPNPKKKRY